MFQQWPIASQSEAFLFWDLKLHTALMPYLDLALRYKLDKIFSIQWLNRPGNETKETKVTMNFSILIMSNKNKAKQNRQGISFGFF